MTFYILRIILLILILVVIYFFFHAVAECSTKKSAIIGAVFSIVITTAVSMFPPENLVTDFSSPENAFKYFCAGEIEEIIYGNDSCLVVYSDSQGTFKDCVFLKSGADYKLPLYFSRSRVAHVFTQNGLFNTYKVSGTSDYYVQGSVSTETAGNIGAFDGNGNNINTNVIRIAHTGFIYFHLGSFKDDYYLVSDGETQPLG